MGGPSRRFCALPPTTPYVLACVYATRLHKGAVTPVLLLIVLGVGSVCLSTHRHARLRCATQGVPVCMCACSPVLHGLPAH